MEVGRIFQVRQISHDTGSSAHAAPHSGRTTHHRAEAAAAAATAAAEAQQGSSADGSLSELHCTLCRRTEVKNGARRGDSNWPEIDRLAGIGR